MAAAEGSDVAPAAGRSQLARVLRSLVGWWVALLVTTLATGALIVHADNAFVLRHLNAPVDADLQPARHGLHAVAAVVTRLGGQPVAGILLVVLAVAFYRLRTDLALALMIIYAGADLVTTIAKLVIQRPGPRERFAAGLKDYSFPSGHSTTAAALLVGAALLLATSGAPRFPARRTVTASAVALLLAVCVAISRLVLGVHFLTDVCAGFLVGTGWAAVVVRSWPTAGMPTPLDRLPTRRDHGKAGQKSQANP